MFFYFRILRMNLRIIFKQNLFVDKLKWKCTTVRKFLLWLLLSPFFEFNFLYLVYTQKDTQLVHIYIWLVKSLFCCLIYKFVYFFSSWNYYDYSFPNASANKIFFLFRAYNVTVVTRSRRICTLSKQNKRARIDQALCIENTWMTNEIWKNNHTKTRNMLLLIDFGL